MVSSSVGVLKEARCKRWISIGFGEEVGWYVGRGEEWLI